MNCGQHSPHAKQNYRAFRTDEPRLLCLLFVCYIFAGCNIYDSELLGRQEAAHAGVSKSAVPWNAPEVARGGDAGAKASALDAPLIDSDVDAGPPPDAGIADPASRNADSGNAPARTADEACATSEDCCPNDPDKTAPGACGCGQPDSDYDSDTLLDCEDPAPRGWLRRLTFDGNQVPSTLADFPVLVHVTDAHLGVFAASDGQDIHFLAADSSTALDYEIERFDPARGELTAWVRVARLEAGQDNALYLAYSDGQEHRGRANNVWSDHHHVWHMTANLDQSEAQVHDSTGHAHAVAAGAMTSANSVAGIAASAIEFDGRDDQLVFENDLTGDTPSTIQAWVIQRRLRPGSYGSAVLMLGDQATGRARFLLSLSYDTGAVKYGFYNNDEGFSAIMSNVWRYLVWTWDGSRSSLFIDGALVEGPISHAGADTRGRAGRIGSTAFDSPRYDFFHSGVLDEVRVSTVSRSREWIATEYANQRPGSTFLKMIGEPEPAR
jgi:hypothetical protein